MRRRRRYPSALTVWKRLSKKRASPDLPEDCRYTMLVCWHKFDRYERHVLCNMLRGSMDKFPFVLVSEVWKALRQLDSKLWIQPANQPTRPVKLWMKRIYNSVKKEDKKRKKRVRLRITV